jgi:hypothetical protein
MRVKLTAYFCWLLRTDLSPPKDSKENLLTEEGWLFTILPYGNIVKREME